MPILHADQPATRAELARWATFSRNEIAGFLADLGILPLRDKYPPARIYGGLLGLQPECPQEEEALGEGLVRLGTVAERMGIGAETLLRDCRKGRKGIPPLYVFGSKRHLFLRAQVDQMVSSPRNLFQDFASLPGHALPASDLSMELDTDPADIATLLENKSALPAHILSGGNRRFIVADVSRRLKISSDPDVQTDSEEPVSCAANVTGGLFSQATHVQSVSSIAAEADRTGSAPRSRRGDSVHTKPAEAKLSDR
ncbi:hypothetical protein [Rhodobacteraceae bacterium DSL-40]|uniref:hypothetical protein n=1 Tax=Amaricoccus sp. B4 TaxID=3368557 RepID=UPI000DAE16BA